MLQRVRIRTLPTRWLTTRPPPPPSHTSFFHRRNIHYNPNPYGIPPPKRFRSRLFDAAVGSTLTVAAWVGYRYYELRKLQATFETALRDGLGKLAETSQEFRSGFAEARRDGDHARLRDLTFAMQRWLERETLLGSDGGDDVVDERGGVGVAAEVGPLPGYAFDDERSGRELVPVEDTLMFLKRDAEDRIVQVEIAVNVDFDEVYRGLADPVAEPGSDKLGELFWRINEQVRFWKRMGRLREGKDGSVDLIVGLCLREKHWHFEYADGHFESMGWGSVMEEADELIAVEDMLRRNVKG